MEAPHSRMHNVELFYLCLIESPRNVLKTLGVHDICKNLTVKAL